MYGLVLHDKPEVNEKRSIGKWNPPPYFYNQGNYHAPEKHAFGATVMNNKSTTDFNTPGESADLLRQRVFQVGSSYFRTEKSSWDASGNRYADYALKALVQGGMAPNPLAVYFFSEDNVHYIQERMKQEVLKHSGQEINNQSIDELLTIMINKILYAYTGILPDNVSCSLEDRLSLLNKAVLEEIVKQVLSGINAYKAYYADASSLPVPMDRPTLSSMSGSRTLMPDLGYDSGLGKTIAANSFNQRYNII